MQKKMKFVSDSTLAQQCYEQLQSEIIEGSLKPGEKLKVVPIKERFGIGQSPVREALSRLVACGLVDVQDNKGFRVSTISEADIRDTYSTFTQIETLALGLALEKGDDNWEAGIVSALHKLSLLENSNDVIPYAQWAEKNYDFHVALIAGCNSSTLLEIRRTLYMKFDRYCRMSYHSGQRELALNHKEHSMLAQAALKRDTQKAQALMSYHVNGAIEDVINNFKKNNLL